MRRTCVCTICKRKRCINEARTRSGKGHWNARSSCVRRTVPAGTQVYKQVIQTHFGVWMISVSTR